MTLNYEKKDDLLIEKEFFNYRKGASEIARIKLNHILGDDNYYYEFEIEPTHHLKADVPEFVTSAHHEIVEIAEVTPQSFFDTKEKALQHAMDVINGLLKNAKA